VSIGALLYLAAGAGELTLTSSDPHVQPRMDYRYLEDPWDRERLREGVRLCLRLLEHGSFSDIVAERIAPTDQDLASDEALDAWMLKNASTCYHVSGTCKMGPAADPMAVVDQYCRVHGLEGLRVVDASVMPDCVRANTNATTIMIAERVADWLK
ncbi:MAG: mycofactocin system GMC family oxidoreductase MftG, partial [Dehalococcoidia bacterium]|nr:mycofactocin system GMC family oxidoreductase MftG [Dehalococcoidia bacterium]